MKKKSEKLKSIKILEKLMKMHKIIFLNIYK